MNFWHKLLLAIPAIASLSLASGNSAQALPDSATLGTSRPDPAMSQVTPVSQINNLPGAIGEVQPTEWAYPALRSLVEKYGCLAGYPNQLFRGNRPMTRYEFAAGLNACMERINELLNGVTADLVPQADRASLQRLYEEFAAELATLRGRVDTLEARTSILEAQQFSTTTKLGGEAIIAVTGVATGQDIPGVDIPRVTTMGYRARLNFDTSFTGRDLLRTRLQAVNLNYFSNPAGTGSQLPEGQTRFDVGSFNTADNTVGIDALLYSFPVGDKLNIVLEANAGASDDFANTINPFLDGDGSSGAISNFGTRNSIYYYLAGSGIGARYQFNDNLELSLGYLAEAGQDPSPRNGLFSGPYGAIAQLTFKPIDPVLIGLTYINAYNTYTVTGSLNSNLALVTGLPTVTNSYGIQASVRITPGFLVNGWVGYTAARVIGTGDADIWNYAIALAFPDLGQKGNLAGIIVGQEPRLASTSAGLQALGFQADPNTSLHVEGFFQYQLSDNISITPGITWLTAPNHDSRNAGIVLGTIRTTFVF